MSLPKYTAAAYARMLATLYPKSRVLFQVGATVFSAFNLGLGDELARINQRASDLLEESDPRTATETLGDWERVLDLETDGSIPIDERRARIVSRYVTRPGGTRPVDYQNKFGPLLDLDPADVEVIEISSAEAAAANDPRLVYQFYLWRDPLLPGSPQLGFAQNELDEYAHSHTRGTIIESKDFLTDDPLSLTDRDILGA